jgi:hypothetical protein
MRLAMGFPLKADEAYRIGLAQWLVPHGLAAKTMEVGLCFPPWPQMARSSSGGHSQSVSLAGRPCSFMALEATEDKAKAIGPGVKSKPVFHGR